MKKKENISIPACKPAQTAALEKLLYGDRVEIGEPQIRAKYSNPFARRHIHYCCASDNRHGDSILTI